LPRQARLDAPGTLHHVIVRGIEKRQIVDDNKDRADFVNRMGALIIVWANRLRRRISIDSPGSESVPVF